MHPKPKPLTCQDYTRGECRRGDRCRFSHQAAQSKPRVCYKASDRECVLCSDECTFLAVGQCNHSICSKCAVRLRFKNKDKSCALCKQEMELMVVAAVPLRPFSEYEVMSSADVQSGSMEYDGPSRLVFIRCREVYAEMESLRSSTCPIEACKQRFPNDFLLLKHLHGAHGLNICPLCLEHQSLFIAEHKLLADAQLQAHLHSKPSVHPLCLFCDQRFFDAQALYQHMRQLHTTCPMCPQELAHRYYESRVALDSHLSSAHCGPCTTVSARGRAKNGRAGGGGGRYFDLNAASDDPTGNSRLGAAEGSFPDPGLVRGLDLGFHFPTQTSPATLSAHLGSLHVNQQQQQPQQQQNAASAVPKPKRLFLAIETGNKALLEAEEWFGEEVLNWQNAEREGKTALIVAVQSNRTDLVRFLLSQPGIDVNRAEGRESGRAPLHFASEESLTDCLLLLIGNINIEINKADSRGKTALHYCCCSDAEGPRRSDCLGLLLSLPLIDVNRKDDAGNAPVDVARSQEVRDALFRAGATPPPVRLPPPPTVPLSSSSSAAAVVTSAPAHPLAPKGIGFQIYKAAEKGNLSALSRLTERWEGNPVLNYANPQFGGFTPLIVACAEGQEDCVRHLLGVAGVNVNAQNLQGESALLWASRCGQAACVRMLAQEEDVDLNCPGNNGRSPLDVAKTEAVRSILKEAIQRGEESK